jgi:hypothetical protein
MYVYVFVGMCVSFNHDCGNDDDDDDDDNNMLGSPPLF